jgi:hypothetical protein
MNSIFNGFDNTLDPNNPEHALIIQNRAIAYAFDDKAGSYKQSLKQDVTHEYALNSCYIMRSVGGHQQGFAEFEYGDMPNGADFFYYLIELYNENGLCVPESEASAIADPDQVNTEKRINSLGICVFRGFAYDFYRELLIEPKHKKAHSLCFRLKVLGIDIEEIHDFLDYQLHETYLGNHASFISFLKTLLRQDRNQETPILNADRVLTVEEWLELSLVSAYKPEKFEAIAPNRKIPIELLHPCIDNLVQGLRNHRFSIELSATDVEQMKKAGFGVPVNGPCIECEFNHYNKGIVYKMAYELHLKISHDYGITKNQVIHYIQGWFIYFSGLSTATIRKSIIPKR